MSDRHSCLSGSRILSAQAVSTKNRIMLFCRRNCLLWGAFMKRLPIGFGLFLVSASLVPVSVSQTQSPINAPATITAPGDGRVAEWMYGEHIPAVPGLPFSAKVELEMSNQLQDGTLITRKTYNLDARDSQGRTRNEARNWIDPATGEEPRLTRVELYDPSTKLRTNLYPLTKVARQWSVGTPGPIIPS